MRRTLLSALALAMGVLGTPYVGFPFQEQLPDVARVGDAYNFQISNETYLSSVSEVSYYADDIPGWMSFDSSSRTFTGTPTTEDVTDSLNFTLIAADTSGNASTTCYLVVSSSTGPQISTNYTVLSQLAEYGQTNGLNSLVLAPEQVFNVTFDRKTFDSDDTIVAYYGKSVERAPLPNWLFFDSTNLRFSGVTPPANSEIAPGFEYAFRLFATDYEGYSGNYVDFGIVVGAHELTTTLKDNIYINGSSGSTVDYQIPLSSVYEDGTEVSLANISSAVLEGAPDWLSLDNYTLSGEVPTDFEDTSIFNVSIVDNYSNTVTLFFQVKDISSLFAVNSFRSVNATRGTFFQYYFLSSDFTDYSSTNVTVEVDNDWMTWHKDNLTINGDTPDDFDSVAVTVMASKDGTDDNLAFEVYGVDPINESSSSSASHSSSSASHSSSSSRAPSSSATSSTSASAATATTTASAVAAMSKSSTNKGLAIGLGVSLPLVAIIASTLIFFFCCYKRRSKKDDDDEEKKSPKISKPILGNPANGPTGTAAAAHSRNGSSPYEKEPQRLGPLNVLKLDDKELYSDSATSSTTNVASFESVNDESRDSLYHDALQAQSTDQLLPAGSAVPKRSWRQTVDSRINRDSLNSLNTVSTNELFSIRLADDSDISKDPRKSNLPFRDSAFFGSTASSILTRDDSGNLQRLDSDGNIVEMGRQRASRATNLDILEEEHSPQIPEYQRLKHDASFTTANSTSTAEEFYPVQTDSGVTWHPSQRTTRAKLRDFTGRSSQADVSNDTTGSGESAEIESM